MLFIWLSCASSSEVDSSSNERSIVIPSGTYTIGPPDGVNLPPTMSRSVTLTYSFAIQRTEVTYTQWLEVMSEIPNQFCDHELEIHELSPDHPVRCVSWCDAVVFANAKSMFDGYLPAYQLSNSFTAQTDVIYCNEHAQFVRLNPSSDGWRLPTEAEWEIAAIDDTQPETAGWYSENANGHAHPAAQFPENKWGLYDTRGNVFEWVWERFGDYQAKKVTDPFHFEIPLVEVYTRPIKGGSFLSSKDGLSAYNRPNASPSMRHPSIGFRLVRTIN